jgi:hypothetical protein
MTPRLNITYRGVTLCVEAIVLEFWHRTGSDPRMWFTTEPVQA